MSWLRAYVFYFFFFSTGLLCCTLICVLGWMLPKKQRFKLPAAYNAILLLLLRTILGIRVRVQGLEHVQNLDRPVIYAGNHQSMWETVAIHHYAKNASPVVKNSLMLLPIFGWSIILLGAIGMHRQKMVRSIRHLHTVGKQRFQQGLSLLIFPQTTRVDPKHLGRFSRTAAKLAKATNTPIIPFAHNAGETWGTRTLMKKSGTIDLVFGKPIDPETTDDIHQAMETWITATMQAIHSQQLKP